MAIVINGSGTVTGISVGGLPDGIVDAGTLATNSVDSAELIDGSIDTAHIATDQITSAILPAGSVLQVLQDVKSAEADLSTDTFTDISGFSQVITPASSSNKVLVNVNIGGVGKHSSLVHGYLQIMRSISGGADTAVHVFTRSSVHTDATDSFFASHESCSFLDSPNTTSATTYKVQFRRHSAAGYWRMNTNTGTNDVTSTLTLMEIGA
jgi:hypothetical protein